MKLLSILAAASVSIAAISGVSVAKKGDEEKTRFLIEYHAGEAQALKEVIEIYGGSVVFDYSSLFNGLAADLNADGLKAVRSSGKTKHIEEDSVRELHELTAHEEGVIGEFAHTFIPPGFPDGAFDEFVPWGRDRVQADVVWSVGPNFGAANNDAATPDVMGGAVTGAGVVVGVLDTGIDHDHPDLMANVINDCGSGVIRDFLPAGGDDCPFDDTDNGHGTSVASVIASVDNTVGLIGVAPDAMIRPYRVCDVSCPLSAIVGGLAQATADGVDVINMSFGGPKNSPFEAAAVQAANQAGVVPVASAGNDASQKVHFPAGYGTVLAVGATDIHDAPASFTNVGGWVDVTGPGVANPTATCRGCGRVATAAEIAPVARTFTVLAMTGSGIADLNGVEAVDAGRGCVATAGDVIPATVAGRVAVITRGACSFAEKTVFAELNGAIGTIIYNSAPPLFAGTLGAFTAAGPTVSMSGAEGATLIADIAGNAGVATVDLEVKATDYWFISGTSFSGPHVAGVAALVKSVDPDLTPVQVRNIITSTAEDIGHQVIFGAGMVRADNAVAAAD